MSFMKPEITARGPHWRVETSQGTWFVPGDVCAVWAWIKPGHAIDMGTNSAPQLLIKELQTYVEPKPDQWASVEVVVGYCGRLSAPGYLDATEWSFARTLRGIRDRLKND